MNRSLDVALLIIILHSKIMNSQTKIYKVLVCFSCCLFVSFSNLSFKTGGGRKPAKNMPGGLFCTLVTMFVCFLNKIQIYDLTQRHSGNGRGGGADDEITLGKSACLFEGTNKNASLEENICKSNKS